MAKDYVARDPRTGLPIATGRQPRKKGTKKQVTGPWQECSRKDILALANGEIPQLEIDRGGRRMRRCLAKMEFEALGTIAGRTSASIAHSRLSAHEHWNQMNC